MTSRRHIMVDRRSLMIPALCSLALTACAGIGRPNAASKPDLSHISHQESSMTTVTQHMSADDIGRRILKLIDSE
jgi:hypothetical protein